MSAAGSTNDASGAQLDVDLVARTQQRQILLGSDVRDDRRVVGRCERQAHDGPLEGEVGDRRGHRGDIAGRRLHRHPDTFRADHQRGLAAGFDGGFARPGFQRGAKNLDLDEVAIGSPGLLARPEVGLADEAGDEDGRRPVVDLGGAADLVDIACVHDRDAVTHRQRFLLVVGHVDERDADLALDAFELELHHLAQLEVEGAERFVEQQARWGS